MNFTSSLFLIGLLPWLILISINLMKKTKNLYKFFIILINIVFYALNGISSFYYLFAISLITWCIHLLLFSRKSKIILFLGCISIITPLLLYKNFYILVDCVNQTFHTSFFETTVANRLVIAPLGISFFSFQAISCICDTYFNRIDKKLSFPDFFSYISFFPTIVSGPIMRVNDFIRDYNFHTTYIPLHSSVERIILGLCKKILLADKIAIIANYYFDGIANNYSFSCLGLWLGAFAYSLQIYFDFSGYSDIAIGIAQIFGIKVPENFDRPYLSKNIQEFWRKWHISLGQWFRDYVYIPLGGNRCNKRKHAFNLLCVWILTGVWHGFNLTFVLWAIGHYVLLLLEKNTKFKHLTKGFLGHCYVLLSVTLLWVPFRSNTITTAYNYLLGLFGVRCSNLFTINELTIRFIPFLILSALLCLPWKHYLSKCSENKILQVVKGLIMLVLTFLIICAINNNTYSPYIYGNF